MNKLSAPCYDEDKMEEAVLALLGALEFENGRVWKRLDFAIMDALHERGLISNPRGHAESVYLTEEGMCRAKALAERMFGADRSGADSVGKDAAKP